jgi:hypothetical protein
VIVEGVKLLVLLATSVIFFIWLYRVTANLPALGVWNSDYGPGRAVGNFFIPFANLILGYRSVRQAWQGSSHDPQLSKSPIVGLWWFFWLASACVAQFAASSRPRPGQASDLNQLIQMSWTYICSDIGYLVAGSLLALVIWRIDRMQAEKFLMRPTPPTMPNLHVPPPPAGSVAASRRRVTAELPQSLEQGDPHTGG